MRRLSAYVGAALLAMSSNTALAQTAPVGELSNDARPLAYRIDLTVDPAKERFSGKTSIDIQVTRATDTLFLHGNELKVTRVQAARGRAAPISATYSQPLTTGVAQLKFARPLRPGRYTLSFDYDAPFRTGAEGLYHVKVGNDWYAWTQMEPLDARRMFPSFDEPRHKVPFTTSITAPAGQKAFANTPLVRSTPAAGGMVRHQFAPSKPLPTYLVAVAVGPFDEATATVPANSVRRQPLTLRHIATKGQAPRLAYGLVETPRILGMLEEYFGIGYPYEKLDQIASPIMGGAMENAGLITYDDTLLLLDRDAPPSQQRGFGNVVAHELAHQWFGNLVTPRWWDDIWLNESFASWMGDKVGAQWRGDLGIEQEQLQDALGAMNGDSRAAGRPIRQPITRNEDVNSAFDGITYAKGGQVLEMMEAYLGPDVFRRGVQRHLRRFPHGTATAEDFFQSISAEAKDPRVVPAFQSFVTQQGVPLISVRPAPGGGVTLSQQRYRPIGVEAQAGQRWLVPVCLRGSSGRQCTLLTDASATVRAPGNEWVMPNAAAAGYYRFDLDRAGWNRLIAAAPQLTGDEAMALADSVYASFAAGGTSFAQVLTAARALSTHPERAAAVYIPGQLASLSETVLTEADLTAYQALMRDLFGARLAELGLDLKRGAYAKDGAERRQLRQTLLSYVAGEGRDRALRKQLIAAAEASLGGDAAALDPSFRGLALAVAVEDRGEPFMNRLHQQMAQSTDPLFRRHAASALGTPNPALTARAIAISRDTKLQNLERLYILFGLLQAAPTRDRAFAHIMANFEEHQKLTTGFGNALLGIGSSYCSADKARAVEAALRPQLASVGGGELDLNRSLGEIRQCAALKAEKGAEISAALRRR
jgi:aminopeptidase N